MCDTEELPVIVRREPPVSDLHKILARDESSAAANDFLNTSTAPVRVAIIEEVSICIADIQRCCQPWGKVC